MNVDIFQKTDNELQEIVNMNVDISETIKIEKWDLRFRFRSLERSGGYQI